MGCDCCYCVFNKPLNVCVCIYICVYINVYTYLYIWDCVTIAGIPTINPMLFPWCFYYFLLWPSYSVFIPPSIFLFLYFLPGMFSISHIRKRQFISIEMVRGHTLPGGAWGAVGADSLSASFLWRSFERFKKERKKDESPSARFLQTRHLNPEMVDESLSVRCRRPVLLSTCVFFCLFLFIFFAAS